ncbi:MAG TPA: DNA-protecting protein DprA [Corynebacteriales bacterium]|nr:DNA-protecting protein DprA [Mycobacteriales bacterium]
MSTSFSTEQLAWAYLARVAEGPCAPLQELIQQIGPVDTAEIIASGANLPTALESKVAARRHHNVSQKDLEIAEANGFQLITPAHECWPHETFTVFDYSAIWDRRRRDSAAYPPYALWVKGNVDLLKRTSVGVVGSRIPSRAGQKLTRITAEELVSYGYVVLSGMAKGVDGIAHTVALELGQPTIAVLACGLDRVYPAAHTKMFHEIAENGLLISEYPPGTRPARHRFLARNRLLAVLACGVVVTSAAWRSGALNTASWARDMGKPVLAWPHSVDDPDAAGCHRLVREGATLVSCGEEIKEELAAIGQLALPLSKDAKETDKLLNRDKKVWEAVSPYFPTSLTEITAESGLPRADVLSILNSLVRQHLLVEEKGHWIRQKD